MIPKKIHYVWLGDADKPTQVVKCINSWKRYLPDYEIIEWNQHNWDLNQNKFALAAFNEKKFAYASDVIRLDVLNRFGGIYLDSDIMVNKSFDELLDRHAFWGFMYDNAISTAVIASEPNNDFITRLLDKYAKLDFSGIADGTVEVTNNALITKELINYYPDFTLGNHQLSLSDGTAIFPKEYFEFPSYDQKTNFSNHLLLKSWGNEPISVFRKLVRVLLPVIIGPVNFGKIRSTRGKKRFVAYEEYEKKQRNYKNTN